MSLYALEVLVKSAVNLPNVEITGKIDPYVLVEYQGITQKTKVVEDNLNPAWNENLVIDLKDKPISASDVLNVTVKDYDKITPDKFVGATEVPLKNLLSGTREMPLKVYLKNKKGQESTSTLELVIKYRAPQKTEGSSSGGITVDQNDGAGGSGGGGGEGGEEEFVAESGMSIGHGIASGDGSSREIKRKIREPYSTKPEDFQVRVKIIEARQLYGTNIPPVCKVNCAGQNKSTKVCSPTNSPFWNETFFFNFHQSQAVLLDQSIMFGVYNSRTMRKDALIGCFKFDLALVYEQEKHSLINKWLLLCDPEDTMSGCKGYLKVSVVILGAGDEAPNLRVTGDENEDIEANLLRPSGVQLRPALFRLRVFRAMDLPQMDSDSLKGIKNLMSSGEDKQFVDPYMEVSFAGKKLKTSKKYGTDHPEWNEELVINFQFPSMCDAVRFTLYDWDRVGNNDAIGTGCINLSHISAFRDDADGFLPTFGPCFVNLYGSPREYTTLPDKYEALNLGKGEGTAYRGRVLIELKTELLDEPIPDEVKPIDPDIVALTQKFFRMRKYRLQAAFLTATQMPGEKESPIEFEVSIGNHGNKLDESLPPCASTTPPTNPVYDGEAYSYLPWGHQKPCGVVDCHWEDISFRIGAVNFLNHMIWGLQKNISKIRQSVTAGFPIEHQAQLAIGAIDQFILECRQPLPQWEPQCSTQNDMDKNLYELRSDQLKMLLNQAIQARNDLQDIDDAIQLLEGCVGSLQQLVIEPQMSFPDVIVWMLKSGKRHAYYRIPACWVFHHDEKLYRGPWCGQPRTLLFKKPKLDDEDDEAYLRAPVRVRAVFWLGLAKDQIALSDFLQEARLRVMAETYENQAMIVGKWSTKRPPLTRPAWSDSTGKTELKKESFIPLPGWRWDGDWYVDPELSVLLEKDSGQTSFVEEIYYNEQRTPTTSWEPANPMYTDAQGEPKDPPENLPLESGWVWDGEWQTDFKRLCDEEGFEYATTPTDESYMATEKLHHMFRRKRLLRKRVLGESGMLVKQTVVGSLLAQKRDERLSMMDNLATETTENWEYAFNFDSKFHTKERKVDMVRRRRWHRLMVPQGKGGTEFVMQLGADQEDSEVKRFKKENLTVPRVYLEYETSHDWHLRVHIFQARNLEAADHSGLSDPYILCSFQFECQRTETIQQTVCPTWDQTLVFEHIEMHGSPESIQQDPPLVTLDCFDWDKIGSNHFLGSCDIVPLVMLNTNEDIYPNLIWQPVHKKKKPNGDLLVAAELILLDGAQPPPPPPRRGDLYSVPDKIRPQLTRKGIEVLCWGLRNMAKYQLANVNSPSVTFEIGGKIIESPIIKNMKDNPNFSQPLLFIDTHLPVNPLYMPAMNITVRDHRAFGQKPAVGLYSLTDWEQFAYPPRTLESDPIIQMPVMTETALMFRSQLPPEPPLEERAPIQFEKRKFLSLETLDDDIDWWSKFYASMGEYERALRYREMGYDLIQVYKTCLEDIDEFGQFQDFCNTFTLVKGKSVSDDDDNYAGEFKGTFRIYELPDDPAAPLPLKYFEKLWVDPEPEECIVRVYVIRALDLQPNDPSGLADPYIEIRLGNKKMSSKDNYVPNTLNPEFGRVFELKCRLPIDKDLRIIVKDYDAIGADDVIGETSIDLENRRLTKFRATCGIPQSYYLDGPCKWRDSKLPTQLLLERCEYFNLPPAEFEEPTEDHPFPTCRFGPKKYSLDQFERGLVPNPHLGPPKERLALHILNQLQMVKEHVEQRPLFNQLQPEIEQGRLDMWVDIFPLGDGIPGPIVDIKPRVPNEYVLRVIVWNTYDVVLDEKSIFGERMSDIYVKGWLSGVDERQKTDVHYRSLDGEGNFNWRFVFPFFYLPSENMVVIKRKEHFYSLDATETRVRPNLIMQVWDNDLFNPDDFLGTLEMNLSNMPPPTKKARECTLEQLKPSEKKKFINLFDSKRTKGYWPFMNEKDKQQVLTGKIEMEMEILTKAEEALRPAGRGQEEPNANPHLDKPKRPETSFLWITSPWKTFKFIIWKRCKWVFIGIIILILVLLLLAIFIYAIPQLLARKMIGV